MRLWHQDLIQCLDNHRLLSQHRECCALRGRGWNKKHATVDYVFKYDLAHLYMYHLEVMREMSRRQFDVDPFWYNRTYRGKNLPQDDIMHVGTYVHDTSSGIPIYKEHDDKYLKECLLNLKANGAELVKGKTVDEMLVKLDLKGIE